MDARTEKSNLRKFNKVCTSLKCVLEIIQVDKQQQHKQTQQQANKRTETTERVNSIINNDSLSHY